MIEGAKLIFFRIMYLGFVVLGAMPIFRFIYAYTLGTDPTYCANALPLIKTGVGMIYPLGYLGIALAGWQMIYRGQQQRQFEGQYSADGLLNAYER